MIEHMFDMLDREAAVLPERLETIPPGLELFAALESVDGAALSPDDRVAVIAARQRLVSWLQASTYADMAALVDQMPAAAAEDRREAATCEVGAALQLTRKAADIEMSLALDLAGRLPRVAELLAVGEIDLRRARTLVSATDHVDEDTARAVVEQVAREVSVWTSGQIWARLKTLCIKADPEASAKRYRKAVRGREVTAGTNPDGAMDIWASNLPVDKAAEAMDRINRIARFLNTGDELRSMDQLRADVFLDLLCGTIASAGQGGTVDITVDLATLTRLAEEPGELAGYGPVIADVARQLTDFSPRATWQWTLRCPECAGIAEVGTTRRRPTATQARRVRARDRCCVFPGCRRPARDCDLDHICNWIHTGRTSVCGLALLCRYHHTRKHRDGWTYERLANGDYRWTSPTGHTYTTRRWRPP